MFAPVLDDIGGWLLLDCSGGSTATLAPSSLDTGDFISIGRSWVFISVLAGSGLPHYSLPIFWSIQSVVVVSLAMHVVILLQE